MDKTEFIKESKESMQLSVDLFNWMIQHEKLSPASCATIDTHIKVLNHLISLEVK